MCLFFNRTENGECINRVSYSLEMFFESLGKLGRLKCLGGEMASLGHGPRKSKGKWLVWAMVLESLKENGWFGPWSCKV